MQSCQWGAIFWTSSANAGCWLVDLADRPVNHLDDEERKRIVNAGVPRLTRTIDETRPDWIVTIKKGLVPDASWEAMHRARHEVHSVRHLPFPSHGWKPDYVSGLAKVVNTTLQAEG